MYGKDYCDAKITCTDYTSSKAYNDEHCPAGSATTVCEQNDYTAWQVKKKVQIRYDIFGL